MARGRRSTLALAAAPAARTAAFPASPRGISPRFRGHTPEDALSALAREPREVRQALGQGGMNALRRLATIAPGTFFHVREVADLVAVSFPGPAERAAVLLHDIGKMVRPQAFAENGGADERPGPELLVAHVTDGLSLARELGLSRLAMDAIAEHHGTLSAGVGVRYPGPRPQTLFTSVLMCADFIESLRAQGKLTREFACELYLSRVQHGQFSRLLESRTREVFAKMLSVALDEDADPSLRRRAREVIDAADGPEFLTEFPQSEAAGAPAREPLGGSRMARSRGRGGTGYHVYG